jgi:phosphoribosylanthranilate isomerase
MFRIKICGITNSSDARSAVAAGADAIGLNFFRKSRRFVEPEIARTIAASLPASVTKVGVFVNHSAGEIAEISKLVGLDYIQLHGDEQPQLLVELPTDVGIVRAHRCTKDGLAPLAQYLNECRSNGRAPDAVLIDADAGAEFGGTGELADWALVAHDRVLLAGLPLILAGGLTPSNVSAAIAAVHPDAVDVASGVEREPGFKDEELVAQFISVAKLAFIDS